MNRIPVPEVSIVIPVYNEERLLATSVRGLVQDLGEHDLAFEIIIAENGSDDQTCTIAGDLAQQDPRIHTFSYPRPNYGGALREGIYRARGRFVLCEEIDLCDQDFLFRALSILRSGNADMVIGSKAMPGSRDRRPLLRRAATRVYNRMLRATLGFSGTDTHGLKAFRRETVVPVVAQCIVEHDVFASELVVRCERRGLCLVEIPVEIEERRAPSIDLLHRLPRVGRNLGRLLISIHLGSPREPHRSDTHSEPGPPNEPRSAPPPSDDPSDDEDSRR
ncbi:MAG: glycosyltransferase [Nannocystaceae bacterium]